MTLPAFVEKARARSEIRNFPARHLEPQLPAHVSRSLRGDGLRPAQGPLLNHRQQKHHLRGDDREPIASERQAAEALFTPKRQPVEPSDSDPAPSAERSKRKPRAADAVAGTGPQQGNRSTGQPRAPDRARDPETAFAPMRGSNNSLTRGTEGSNLLSSSGQSVSLPQPLSSVENPGFPGGCARLTWGLGRQRRAGLSIARQPARLSLSGHIPVPRCR
jgi:hypothetical protein